MSMVLFRRQASLLQDPDEQSLLSMLPNDAVGLVERKVQRKKSCGMRHLSTLNLKRGRAADADGDDLERAPRGFHQLLHSAPSTPLRWARRSVTGAANLSTKRLCSARRQFALFKAETCRRPRCHTPKEAPRTSSIKNAQVQRSASVDPNTFCLPDTYRTPKVTLPKAIITGLRSRVVGFSGLI